jgi:hypothetical protein
LYETAYSIVAGAFEQTIDVRERAGSLIRATAGDDCSYAQPLDRLG